MKISPIMAAFGMALAATVSAGPWELSLGLTARTVGDFDIKSDIFVNPAFPDSPYVTGILGYDGQPQLALLADPVRQGRLLGDVATLHRIDFGGASEGLDSAMGVLFAARTPLGDHWDRTWMLNLSAMWFSSDVSASGSVVGTTEQFDVLAGLDVPPGGVWDNPDFGGPNTVWVYPYPDDPSGPGTTLPGVYGVYDIDLELDAYTFGAGIGTDVVLPFGSLRLEVGPTLTVVDYDAEALIDVRWDSDDASVFDGGAARVDDSGIEFMLGFYGDLSFVYDFNERFGVGIGVRYDYVFEKLDTDLGEVDLSGISGAIKAVYRF
jgi:hypothetical protein